MTSPVVRCDCPSKQELGRFCRGDLSVSRSEELAEHLEACHECQTALHRVADHCDGLLSDLRGIGLLATVVDNSLSGELAAAESNVVAYLSDTCAARLPAAGHDVPRRLGDYEILAPVGRGGMGAVYLARHFRLDKVVAMKLLPSQRLDDREAVARFQREMRAVGKLSHPNIVAATDAGEIDGIAFLAMEFVEGTDLARLVERHGSLPIAEACELARQAAVGLDYAHAHGLVHRDVKPSNLLLAAAPDQPAGGLVKLADLGLALLNDPESDTVGQATSANLMIGSLDYMAPEQVDNAHQVDHRADLYGLGCTLFELLSGKPPFAAPTFQTRLQKMKAHADAPVPSLAAVCPGLPAGLEHLVRRLLAKNPEDRFAAAAEVAAALKPLAAGADLAGVLYGTSPPRAEMPFAGHKPRRRLPGIGILLGCFAAAMLATVIYLQTDRGRLEIRSDDDGVKVRVEQAGKLHVRRQPPTLLRAPFNADEAKRHQERWARFRGVPAAVKNELGMALTLVPPGEFEMRPGYRVKLTKPYYMGVHEVTVGQFRQFAEMTGYKSLLEAEGRGTIDIGSFKEVPGMNWRNPALAPGDDHPVAGVNWFDAEKFCTWLSEREKKRYRLPTEAEWEWAARGGTASMYGWGDDANAVGDYEWYDGNSNRHSHVVGQKRANAWGLYDTNGNVVEWCQDWAKDSYPQGEVSDPTGPVSTGTRTLRGGSYIDGPLPYVVRGAFDPASSMIHCGFRVCREL